MCLKRVIAIMKVVWQLLTWMLWSCIFDESNSDYEMVMAAVSKHGRSACIKKAQEQLRDSHGSSLQEWLCLGASVKETPEFFNRIKAGELTLQENPTYIGKERQLCKNVSTWVGRQM